MSSKVKRLIQNKNSYLSEQQIWFCAGFFSACRSCFSRKHKREVFLQNMRKFRRRLLIEFCFGTIQKPASEVCVSLCYNGIKKDKKAKTFITKLKWLRLTDENRMKGDAKAEMDYVPLFSACCMKVYSFVMTMAENQDFSEEIIPKTFYKAMTADIKHRGDSSEFAWLCAIAENLFADEQRAGRKTAGLDAEIMSDTDIENSFIDKDTACHIHKVLHGPEDSCKEIFQLRVFGELSFQKIGAIFDNTENWVRAAYHRTRLKIQERMEAK